MPRLIVKTLPKHILKTVSAVRRCKVRNHIPEKLKGLGWKEKHPPNDCVGICYFVSPCNKYFLKQSYISGDIKPNRHAIPTMIVKQDGEHPWLLQPKANVSDNAVSKAYDYFIKKSGTERFSDLHMGNVAIYKKKHVLIDW